jgi:hypothetical protein
MLVAASASPLDEDGPGPDELDDDAPPVLLVVELLDDVVDTV